MLNFIRRWLFNRSRYIFQFWDGTRIVKADPLVLWRALQQHEDFREEDLILMKVEALRLDLIRKVAGVVREVFSIALPNSGGLTEMECLEVLRRYIEYTRFQKKSGELMQNWPTTSDMEVSDDSTPEMNTSEGSGST